MKDFGVQFRITNYQRFASLVLLWEQIKHDKNSENFRDPSEWPKLVPDEVKGNFEWPTNEERNRWLAVRDVTPIAIGRPGDQVGARWNFYSVFEGIENGEYLLLDCVDLGNGLGEMRIDTFAYPYGGVGPFIALAEAFGFVVTGANEYGEFEALNE